FFFFQAEDGIRDFHVTGVQTCALPIYSSWRCHVGTPSRRRVCVNSTVSVDPDSEMHSACQFDSHQKRQRNSNSSKKIVARRGGRSEERRGGKGWRERGGRAPRKRRRRK